MKVEGHCGWHTGRSNSYPEGIGLKAGLAAAEYETGDTSTECASNGPPGAGWLRPEAYKPT